MLSMAIGLDSPCLDGDQTANCVFSAIMTGIRQSDYIYHCQALNQRVRNHQNKRFFRISTVMKNLDLNLRLVFIILRALSSTTE